MQDEDVTLSRSINQGKKDWQKVIANQQKLITEAEDVMGGSDIPATQPTAGGVEGGVKDTMTNVSQTISQAGDSKEFEKIKKDLLLSISKEKQKLVTKISRLFPQPDKMDLSELIDTMKSVGEEFEAEKQKLVPQLSQTIQKYNTIVDTAIKHTLGSMGLAVERMKLPENIHSLEDFKNMAIFYGDFDNIIGDVIRDAEKDIKQQIGNGTVLGARLIDEAFAGKRNVQAVDDPISSLQNVKQRIPHKYAQAIRQSGLSKQLANAFILVAKSEVLDAMIKGVKQKLQRLEASAKAQDAIQAKKDAEIIVLDPIDFGVDSPVKKSQVEPVEEMTMQFRTGHGPGKIADVYNMPDQIVKESKKVSLNEGWEKYRKINKDKKNTEKPDDFNLLMG